MSKKTMTEKKVVIDILGHNWGVSIVPQAYPRLLKSDGLACFKSKEIYLSGHLSREKLKKVLLEEYSYAFFFELEELKIYFCKGVWLIIQFNYILLTLEKCITIDTGILMFSF